MNRRLTILTLLAAIGLCGGLAPDASAAGTKEWDVILTVPHGLNPLPNDAHITFTATGGIKSADSKSPLIAKINTSGDLVDIYFGPKLTPGVLVRFHFITVNDPVDFLSGVWLNDEIPIGPINAANITVRPKTTPEMPGASPVVLVLLSLVILGSGIFVLRSRNAGTA